MVVKSVAQLLAHVRADFDDLDLIVMDLRMPHATALSWSSVSASWTRAAFPSWYSPAA